MASLIFSFFGLLEFALFESILLIFISNFLVRQVLFPDVGTESISMFGIINPIMYSYFRPLFERGKIKNLE